MLRKFWRKNSSSKEIISHSEEEKNEPPKSDSKIKSPEDMKEYYEKVCEIEDPVIRARELLPFAEAGITQAMVQLALANEKNGKTDDVIPWLKKAADNGNYEAYYEWGKRILEAAANLNSDTELIEAGLVRWCTAAGGGVHKAVQALTVYNHVENKAAAQVFQPILDKWLGEWMKTLDRCDMYADTQYTKGLWYFYGVGYNKDMDKAREWFQKAAAQGHTYAQKLLEDFF